MDMEQQMRQLINDVFYDLEDAIAGTGEKLDAEILADVLGDRMYDESEEYRNTPWEKRREMTLQIAREYV
jgi:hypothetical protein